MITVPMLREKPKGEDDYLAITLRVAMVELFYTIATFLNGIKDLIVKTDMLF